MVLKLSESGSLFAFCFVALAALALLGSEAHADGKPRRPANAVGLGSSGDANAHQSVLRISARDRLPQVRAVRLGRNKSMLIELPSELRDVVVSNPEIMDAMVQTSDRVYLIGKKQGQSNAFFFDVHGEQILTLEVTIENDTMPLEALLSRLLPGSDIKVEMLNDTVILTGAVRSPTDSNRASDLASRFVAQADGQNRATAKVINMLTVEGEEQVMLKVVVAEVQREALKQLGVNLCALIQSGSFTTALLTDNTLAGLGRIGINTTGATAGALTAVLSPVPAASGDPVGNSGVAGFGRIGSTTVAHTLRALERLNLMKTLAEPNLTAISGEAAKFRAGGEFPVVVQGKDGPSVSFKEYGVLVAFTPHVLSEGRISLKIETEVSELTEAGGVSIAGFSIPGLRTRKANSTVELPSGGSLAMAGLLSDDVRQNADGFPGLKDVPILGTLFRSREFIKRETELVVIVTPYTVRPTARKNLATPGDGLAPASDLRANFLGHLNRIYGRDVAIPAGSIKDYGFIVE